MGVRGLVVDPDQVAVPHHSCANRENIRAQKAKSHQQAKNYVRMPELRESVGT